MNIIDLIQELKDMIKKKWFDVVITTCGALDHDIARHFSNYNQG